MKFSSFFALNGIKRPLERKKSTPQAVDWPGVIESQCRPLWGQTAQQQRVTVLLGLSVTDEFSVAPRPGQRIA